MNITGARILSHLLDPKLFYPHSRNPNQTLWLSFSPQRSGQHLIISWLCTGIGNVLHFNHCRFFLSRFRLELQPLTGRRLLYQNEQATDDSGIQGRNKLQQSLKSIESVSDILYSMEDLSPEAQPFDALIEQNPAKQIIILRDPCNWIASSIKHGKSSKLKLESKIQLYKSLLRLALKSPESSNLTFINYQQFVANPEYRKKIANRLQLSYFEAAEETLSETPDFGGGSSFQNEIHTVEALFSRWKSFKNDPLFLEMIRDEELWELSENFFGTFPGMLELRP
jgi:hypothetical protein